MTNNSSLFPLVYRSTRGWWWRIWRWRWCWLWWSRRLRWSTKLRCSSRRFRWWLRWATTRLRCTTRFWRSTRICWSTRLWRSSRLWRSPRRLWRVSTFLLSLFFSLLVEVCFVGPCLLALAFYSFFLRRRLSVLIMCSLLFSSLLRSLSFGGFFLLSAWLFCFFSSIDVLLTSIDIKLLLLLTSISTAVKQAATLVMVKAMEATRMSCFFSILLFYCLLDDFPFSKSDGLFQNVRHGFSQQLSLPLSEALSKKALLDNDQAFNYSQNLQTFIISCQPTTCFRLPPLICFFSLPLLSASLPLSRLKKYDLN